MPRLNQPRSVFSERALAERIKHERAARGWTLENVAERMRARGCPINNSAIYKIEKWDPPRRITVDELVAFASIFEMTVEQLLVPVELISHERFAELISEAEEQILLSLAVDRRREAATHAIEAYADEHPEVLAKFRDSKVLKEYLEHVDSLVRLAETSAAGLLLHKRVWEVRVDLSRQAEAEGMDPQALKAQIEQTRAAAREDRTQPLAVLAEIVTESGDREELVKRLGEWVSAQQQVIEAANQDG